MMKNIFGVILCIFAFIGVSSATEFRSASVRALGMGGSSVASTHDVDASYWNPAAYGFFGKDTVSDADNNGMSGKDFGLELDVDLGLYIFGPLEKNRLIAQSLPTSVLNATGTFTSAQIVDAAKLVDGLGKLDSAPQGVNIFGNATVGSRVANYGLGVRLAGDFNNSVSIDNKNIGLNVFTSFVPGGVLLPVLPPTAYFSNAQAASLHGALVTSGMTAQQANSVVGAYDAALALDTTAAGQQQAMIDALLTIANAGGDLTLNGTTLSTRGVSIVEAGITYGYAFNENFSVGTVLKYIQADIIALDVDILGQNTSVASINRSSFETSTGAGIDLGAMYRIPNWQFGLTVKNINSPSFQHSSGYVYELKTQAKAGVAWIPTATTTVEIAFDLTENEGVLAADKSQYWNFGAEWNVLNVLALRAGAFQNISDSVTGIIPTLGLGVNMWAARLDIGMAQSLKEIDFDGNTVPAYQLYSAALAIDF